MDRPEERIALIEIEGRDGRVVRSVDVTQWPLTLGRALDNHVVLDDPHVAPHHARIAPGPDGTPVLAVLNTRNGVVHQGRRIAEGETWPLPAGGTVLHFGALPLRLRLRGEELPAERPLMLAGAVSGRALLALALGLLAVVAAGHWVGLDPGADYSAWLPVIVGLPVALVGWCGVWALMSKLFLHRFDFAGHLRVALPWLLASALVDTVWPQATAAVGMRWAWHLTPLLQALLLALLVRAHLAVVLPTHRRAVTAIVAALVLGAGTVSMALVRRATDSYSRAPYVSTLPLPALRLAGTVPPQTLVQDIGPLVEKLSRRVEQARRDDRANEDGTD